MQQIAKFERSEYLEYLGYFAWTCFSSNVQLNLEGVANVYIDAHQFRAYFTSELLFHCIFAIIHRA